MQLLLRGDVVRVKTGTYKGHCGFLKHVTRRPGMHHGFWKVEFQGGGIGHFCSLELEKVCEWVETGE